jgi:hypothetical protein
MTKLTISVQDWDIPNLLKEIKNDICSANKLIEQAANKLDKVTLAQETLKITKDKIIKNHK